MWKRNLSIVLAALLGLGGGACDRRDNETAIDIEGDTLELTVPDDAEERIERGARQVGGAVGEALEETGEAIEEAGARIQEEVQDSEAADTVGD